MKKIVALGLLMIAALLTGNAESESYRETVQFKQAYPLLLSSGVPVTGEVKFGKAFSSISRMCFISKFEKDLADTDEGLFFGPFGKANLGWVNIQEKPVASKKVCLDANHSQTQYFLDGEQSFQVAIEGQANLSELTIVIEGVELPSEDNLIVSVELAKGEAFIPARGGQLEYSTLVRNIDQSLPFRDLVGWSVLTLPNGERYPEKLARDFPIISGGDRKFADRRLEIPAWFPAGEYRLTWYIADKFAINSRRNPLIMEDSLLFSKAAD